MESALVESWVETTLSRYMPPLEFPEIRRGAVAVSSLYVEGRNKKNLARRSVEGEGKRAAFATYYAPLHFLTTAAFLEQLPPDSLRSVRRVLDLGSGTGACGAALALGAHPDADRSDPPEVIGVDRSGWALGEASRTYRHFGFPARTKKGVLPRALPRVREGDALICGWSLNELSPDDRSRMLDGLEKATQAGATVLIFEPLSLKISPWWPRAADDLAPSGFVSETLKFAPELPAWVEKLDTATGLDHTTLGARVLYRLSPSE